MPLLFSEDVYEVAEVEFKSRSASKVRCVLAKGDITQVRKKYDLMVVSVIPGSYIGGRGTVVNALKKRGIDLNELAKNKAEDLRATHNTWISKKLDGDSPYKQVMCLELLTPNPHNVVGTVFRSMIALAPDAKSVIMPILCSRGGGGLKEKVVEGTMRAFFAWNRRGLAVEELTIVLFEEGSAEELVTEAFMRTGKQFGTYRLIPRGKQQQNEANEADVAYSHASLTSSSEDDELDAELDELDVELDDDDDVLADFEEAEEEGEESASSWIAPPPRGAAAPITARKESEKKAKSSKEKKKKSKSNKSEDKEKEEEQVKFDVVAEQAKSAESESRKPSFWFGWKRKSKRGSVTKPKGKTEKTKDEASSAKPQQKRLVVISYAPHDKPTADALRQLLTLALHDLSDPLDVKELTGSDANEETFELSEAESTISKAHKVLAVITPSYLESPSCLDHFNIALYSGDGILVPILTKNAILPRYMTLVQYQDARPGTYRAMFPALLAITDPRELKLEMAEMAANGSKANTEQGTQAEHQGTQQDLSYGKQFDVFISYSQRFSNQARAAKEILEHLLPGVRCFLDTINLQTGGSWQASLYESLDSTHSVLCLVSPPYLTSLFCQDELAVAKLLEDEMRAVVVANCVIPFDGAQGSCPPFLRRKMKDGESLFACCERLVEQLVERRKSMPAVQWRDTEEFSHDSKMRRLETASNFYASSSISVLPRNSKVVVVGSKEEEETVAVIQTSLSTTSLFRGAIEVLTFSPAQPKPDFSALETCVMIVPVLSPSFLSTEACMTALHMAVFRNRTETRCLMPLVAEPLPEDSTPSFVRLLPRLHLDRVNLDKIAPLIAKAAALAAHSKFDDNHVLPVLE